jgi:hypothetical protein
MATAYVAYLADYPGATLAQYDAMVAGLDLGGAAAPGSLVHVVGAHEGGVRVVDVWESAAVFEAFMRERVVPLAAKHGLPPPTIVSWPVHNVRTMRDA